MKLTAASLLFLVALLGVVFVMPTQTLAQGSWTHSFLDTNDDPSDWLTLTPVSVPGGNCTPILTGGNIIEGCTPVDNSANWSTWELNFPSCVITSLYVTVEYNRTRENGTATDVNYSRLNSDYVDIHYIGPANSESTFTLVGTNLNTLTTNVNFYGLARNNSASDGSYHRIVDITISGLGQDPFVNGSCDPGSTLNDVIHPLAPSDRDTEWGINALLDMDYVYSNDPDYFPNVGLEDFPLVPPPGYSIANGPTNTSTGVDYFTLLPEWYSTFAISNVYNANVLNVSDGFVVSVTPITEDMCRERVNPFAASWFFNKALRHNCLLVMPRSTVPGDDDLIFLIDPTAAYLVTISDSETGDFFEYLVTNPTVEAGSNILAGCILGTTLEILNLQPLELESVGLSAGCTIGTANIGCGLTGSVTWAIVSPITGKGVAFVTQRSVSTGESVSLRSRMVIDNVGSNACTSDESLASCLGTNPKFKNGGEGWTLNGPGVFNEPGVTLQPGASVETTYALQASYADYYANLNVSSPAYFSQVQVTIGAVSQTFETRQVAQNIQFQVDPPTLPVVPIIIKNTGTVAIFVEYFCVTDGPPSQPPGQCYFKDFSFTYGSPDSPWDENQWTLDKGIGLYDPIIDSGGLLILNNATFSQPVTLYPQDDGSGFDYRIRITYRVMWNETVASWATGEAQIAMEWPDGDGFNLIEQRPIADITAHPDPYQWKFQTFETQYIKTVTTDPISGEMTFLVANQYNTDMIGFVISEACIEPVTEPEFPGPPGGGGYIPPFQVTCTGDIPYPIGGDVGQWLAWHWHNLDQFFQCDLMKMLNSIHETAMDTYQVIIWMFRYSIATTLKFTGWGTGQVIPWLNGHFNNLAQGRVTYVDQAGGANVWDVLYAIINSIIAPIVDLLTRLLGGAAEILFNVVNGIISIVFGFFAQLFNFMGMIQNLLNSIVLSFNTATPEVIPGVPNCAVDPQGQMLCVGFWVMDNTIFSGPGALIIPLIISIASIHFIIWGVREFKRVFASIQAV